MFLLSYDDTKTEVCQERNRDSPNLQNLVGFPFEEEKLLDENLDIGYEFVKVLL